MKKEEKVKICKLAKKNYLKTNLKEYTELVKNPRFVCSKCGRVTKENKFLCKSVELE